jgi:hypothetical protein
MVFRDQTMSTKTTPLESDQNYTEPKIKRRALGYSICVTSYHIQEFIFSHLIGIPREAFAGDCDEVFSLLCLDFKRFA